MCVRERELVEADRLIEIEADCCHGKNLILNLGDIKDIDGMLLSLSAR